MFHNEKEVNINMDELIKSENLDAIIAIGGLSSLYSLRKILVTGQEDIKKEVSNIGEVNEATEEMLIKAEAVSDAVDIVLSNIADLAEKCCNCIPIDPEILTEYIKSVISTIDI